MKYVTMMSMITCLLIAGCVSFNRDALWNAPITAPSYCTYFNGDFPIGSVFVHRQDDWTDKRLEHEYELTVMQTNGQSLVVLDHGWTVYDHFKVDTVIYLHHNPILVDYACEGSTNECYKVGDMFKSYGQYKYVSNLTIDYNGKPLKMKYFKKINKYIMEE